MEDDKLSINMDMLKEVASMGVGNAAGSLSMITRSTVFMNAPNVYMVPVEKVPDILGSEEMLVAAIYMEISGDISGGVLIIIPQQSASDILEKLEVIAEVTDGTDYSEDEISALKEVGNILGCSYLNALGDFLDISIIPSPPSFAFDMVGAILDFSVIDLSNVIDNVMMFETDFFEREGDMKGFFIFLPDERSSDLIVETINKKYKVD